MSQLDEIKKALSQAEPRISYDHDRFPSLLDQESASLGETTSTLFTNALPVAEPRPRERPLLRVLCGLPRSGKTTFARTLLAPIVSPDAIRLALHGEAFVSRAEPFVWAMAQTMVRALFEAGHAEVTLDATNTTQERRRMWEHPDWRTKFIHFSASPDLCMERAERGGFPSLVPVIERMAQQWEPFREGQNTVLAEEPAYRNL